MKHKKPIIHQKTTTKGQKTIWKQYDYSCCVDKALSDRKKDGLGSEKVASVKLKSAATLPLATAESGFPPICSTFTLGSIL